VPSHYLAQAARRWMTVALNGDGGDELFGGYARPMLARVAAPYRRLLPQSVRSAAARALHDMDGGPLRRLALLARAGAVSAAESFTYDRAFRLFRAEAYPDAFLASLGDVHPDALYREVWDRSDGVDDVSIARSTAISAPICRTSFS
jgi:asparagine synthase (glutamine-hydrolysing)